MRVEEPSHGECSNSNGIAEDCRKEVQWEEKRALGRAEVLLVRERDTDELRTHDWGQHSPHIPFNSRWLTEETNAIEYAAIKLDDLKLSSVQSTSAASVVAAHETAVTILIAYAALATVEDFAKDGTWSG